MTQININVKDILNTIDSIIVYGIPSKIQAITPELKNEIDATINMGKITFVINSLKGNETCLFNTHTLTNTPINERIADKTKVAYTGNPTLKRIYVITKFARNNIEIAN